MIKAMWDSLDHKRWNTGQKKLNKRNKKSREEEVTLVMSTMLLSTSAYHTVICQCFRFVVDPKQITTDYYGGGTNYPRGEDSLPHCRVKELVISFISLIENTFSKFTVTDLTPGSIVT